MTKIQIGHKGFAIYYREDENLWIAPQIDVSADNLKAVKEQIDATFSDTKLNVIYIGRGPTEHEAQSGTVQRVNVTNRYRDTMVFTYPDGKQREVEYRHLVLDTPENRETLQKMAENLNERSSLNLKYMSMESEMKQGASALLRSTIEGMSW